MQRELMSSVFGNKWWGHLIDSIRSFAADYSTRLNIDRLLAQKALELRGEGAVNSGDSDKAVLCVWLRFYVKPNMEA